MAESLMVGLDPSPAFGKIAEGAGDAWWRVVTEANQVDEVCREAIRVVGEEKRCALIEVVIDKIYWHAANLQDHLLDVGVPS